LTSVYFTGNRPTNYDSTVFSGDSATAYYLPDTSGWGSTFAGIRALEWDPPIPFGFLVVNGAISIADYLGSGDALNIPGEISGLPVTGIETNAFQDLSNLTNVTIPGSVASIGLYAFQHCSGLANITIPASVTTIEDYAFFACSNLTAVYFMGNAPAADSTVFFADSHVTVYYLPGTTGWGTTFGGSPTALWRLPQPVILSNGSTFGVLSNQFGFVISWATNGPVVVESCTNLANPVWSPVATNNLSDGMSSFGEAVQTNISSRFYRVIQP
jgi:hypothetical protein